MQSGSLSVITTSLSWSSILASLGRFLVENLDNLGIYLIQNILGEGMTVWQWFGKAPRAHLPHKQIVEPNECEKCNAKAVPVFGYI